MRFLADVLSRLLFHPEPAAGGQLTTKTFTYDFNKHGGVKDVAIVVGTLPLNWVTTGVAVICKTPLAGATATFDLGTHTTPNDHFDDQAITALDTAGKTVSMVETSHVAATTDNLRQVEFLINTANLTAGEVDFRFTGYIADQSTGKLADTSY